MAPTGPDPTAQAEGLGNGCAPFQFKAQRAVTRPEKRVAPRWGFVVMRRPPTQAFSLGCRLSPLWGWSVGDPPKSVTVRRIGDRKIRRQEYSCLQIFLSFPLNEIGEIVLKIRVISEDPWSWESG
jgi:hypothetical protein